MTDPSFAGETIETARRRLAERFRSSAIDSAELDARLLTGEVLGLDLTGLITAANRTLAADESDRLEFIRAAPPRRRAGRAHCGP